MSPALAARIEASVRGRRGGSGGAVAFRRFVSWFRLIVLVFVVAAVGSLVRMRHRNQRELERARDALLVEVRARARLLAPEDRRAIARLEPWLVRASGAYEGDLIASELTENGSLASILSRPLVYVRGPTSDFDGRTGSRLRPQRRSRTLFSSVSSSPQRCDRKARCSRKSTAPTVAARVWSCERRTCTGYTNWKPAFGSSNLRGRHR